MCPNNCNWRVLISGLTEEQQKRISRWAKNWLLCPMIIPYSKEVKEDLENEKKYAEECKKIRDSQNWKITTEQIHNLQALYPYKQLWYNWRIQNRWSKWGLCECEAFPTWFGDELELQFWTAWSPQIPVFKKLSKKYHCSVSYDYDEPWCWFSGSCKWVDWEEMYREEYDDAYYWEWVVCSKCWLVFDWTNEENWTNLDLHLCYDCWHQWTWHE